MLPLHCERVSIAQQAVPSWRQWWRHLHWHFQSTTKRCIEHCWYHVARRCLSERFMWSFLHRRFAITITHWRVPLGHTLDSCFLCCQAASITGFSLIFSPTFDFHLLSSFLFHLCLQLFPSASSHLICAFHSFTFLPTCSCSHHLLIMRQSISLRCFMMICIHTVHSGSLIATFGQVWCGANAPTS